MVGLLRRPSPSHRLGGPDKDATRTSLQGSSRIRSQPQHRYCVVHTVASPFRPPLAPPRRHTRPAANTPPTRARPRPPAHHQHGGALPRPRPPGPARGS